MISRKKFDMSMQGLLFFKGIEPNDDANNAYYALLKNEFDDKEFGDICLDICKTEEFYNKYPDPKLFFDRKKEAEKTVFIEEGSFYIDNTMPEYKPVLEHLSNEQSDRVCENLWHWLIKNKRGEFVSQQFIVERLKQFMPVQSEETQIEDERVKQLLLTATKKIGG